VTLTAGTRFGAYDILSLIGIGGMGEVYCARDRKLGRNVAIKVLPAGLADDPDRLARFEREARALAALNHRHIGAIYGFEEADGIRALVLELIDARRWRSGWPKDRCRPAKRWRSRGRLPRHSTPRTSAASCTAI
jgi:serine/threonine protein kinase